MKFRRLIGMTCEIFIRCCFLSVCDSLSWIAYFSSGSIYHSEFTLPYLARTYVSINYYYRVGSKFRTFSENALQYLETHVSASHTFILAFSTSQANRATVNWSCCIQSSIGGNLFGSMGHHIAWSPQLQRIRADLLSVYLIGFFVISIVLDAVYPPYCKFTALNSVEISFQMLYNKDFRKMFGILSQLDHGYRSRRMSLLSIYG